MVKRGEVYFVTLDPVKRREQAGNRPVLVVSADAINAVPLVVTIIVGTKGANQTRDYPTNVRVTPGESGLPEETVFLGFQIRSLDPGRFRTPAVGVLPPARMAEVDLALRRVLSL